MTYVLLLMLPLAGQPDIVTVAKYDAPRPCLTAGIHLAKRYRAVGLPAHAVCFRVFTF